MARKIGILGGTFDPIHIGHLYIAYEAKQRLELDEVIFMPSGNPPHKSNKSVTESNLRYEMVKLAIDGYSGFSASDYEINKQGLSYTYETLIHFKEVNKDCELYFITGADCLVELGKWKNVDIILDNCTLVVFNRKGYTREKIFNEKKAVEYKYDKEIIFLDLLQIDISSTWIRDRIKEGYKADFFLPGAVISFIEEKMLYNNL